MNSYRILYMAALLSLFSSFACADISVEDVAITPNVVWLHASSNAISIHARCSYNGASTSIATVTASIFPLGSGIPSTSEMYYDTNNDRFALTGFSFPFSEPGTYGINITCSRNGESTSYMARIAAEKLTLELIKDGPEVDGYMGDYLTLKAAFQVDDGSGNKIIPPPQGMFGVSIGSDYRNTNVNQKDIKVIGNQYQSIMLVVPNSADDSNYLTEGLYDIEITGKYTAYGSTTTITTKERAYVRINPSLKIILPDQKITCIAGDLCSKTVEARVVFPMGDIDTFTTDNFEAVAVGGEAVGKKVSVTSVSCDKKTDTCRLYLDIPSTLNSGLYDLFITVAHPQISNYDYQSKSSMPLATVVRLSGEMKDASGGIVDTKFTLENKDNGQITTTSTDSNGLYSIDLIPGNYDFEARFSGGTTAKFKGVKVAPDIGTQSLNFIRFDKDSINSNNVPATRAVKIVVVEFALPFESAQLYIPYDSSKVNSDENELMVHNCIKWNFKKRVCTGEWTSLTRQVHSIQDSLDLNTNSTGAFIVGEKRLLSINDIDVKTETVYMNDPISIVGRVLDADGSPAVGTGVVASFPSFDLSKSTVTKDGGLFSIDINAPIAEGPVTMMVSLANPEFAAGNYTKSIDVLRKKELSIIGLPDMVDVDINKSNSVSFKLVNTGQTNLTKPIYVHITGISTDWYDVLPMSINGIAAGEQKTGELKIQVTPEMCGGECPAFTLVTLEAKSDEIDKSTTFTLRVNQPQAPQNASKSAVNKQPGETGTGAGEDLFKVPDITGFATSIPGISLDNTYIFLTFIVILVFIIISKKKKKAGGPRASVVDSLHKIKTGI